jgi:amino acid permease
MPLALIFLIAFLFIFGVTLGSGVWPYISYMMPNQEVTGALILNWLLAGISIISFAFVTDTNSKNSPYVMLFIYCGITFVLSIVNAVMLIDIKGLSVRRAQLKLQ